MATENTAGATNAAAEAAAAAEQATETANNGGVQDGSVSAALQNELTKRDAWKQRYKQRYAPEAEDVDIESDDYYDNLTKMADEYDRMEGNEKQMNDLLASNPSFSDMIRDAKEGKSFFSSLVERFGVDYLKQAMEDPAVAEELDKANDAFKERMMRETEDKETSQRNMEESANNIQKYAQEHNLTDEQMNEVIIKMTDFVKDGLNGLFPTELIDMVYKAQNYDTDVEQARETGIVQGRNENIAAQLERSASQPDLPPNIGQSGTLPTEQPVKKRTVRNPLTGKEIEY